MNETTPNALRWAVEIFNKINTPYRVGVWQLFCGPGREISFDNRVFFKEQE